MPTNCLLFLNLTAFSNQGGIEKFNRCFLKALHQLSQSGLLSCNSFSLYDNCCEEYYYPSNYYTACNGNKIKFIYKALLKIRKHDTIILGHLHLSIFVWLIKLLYSPKRIIIIIHGIEAEQNSNYFKRFALLHAHNILAVSNYTKSLLLKNYKIKPLKIIIFPNTIDPKFLMPRSGSSKDDLRLRYNIGADKFVLFTLARLSFAEQYKGYDKVLACLPNLIPQYPQLIYVLAGKADDKEFVRITELISQYKIKDHVKLIGFIHDDELYAHYNMANLFIMPSYKEGFGIVFLEALIVGLPVIGGNIDGTVDALDNGRFGTLINPNSNIEIQKAIVAAIEKHSYNYIGKENHIASVINKFGFDEFKKRLNLILKAA